LNGTGLFLDLTPTLTGFMTTRLRRMGSL